MRCWSIYIISLRAMLVQVRRNVLDVSYHVSQYQNIIAELKGEIERLKDKMNTEPVREETQRMIGRAGHATTLLRQREHVFRPQSW